MNETICTSLLNADDIGNEQYKEFVQCRLVDNTVSFHAPIKQCNIKTFASMAAKTAVTTKTKKTKEIIAERNVFGQLVRLAACNNLSLEKVLSYPLGPIPWSLATHDGIPLSTNKAPIMHLFEKGHILPTKPDNEAYVIDGNHYFHSLIGLPDTFGQLAKKVLDSLPEAKRVDFVTDSYKPDSIKGRQSRDVSERFFVRGEHVKIPRDFKKFFSNLENKMQLFELILKEWSKDKYAQKVKNREIYYVIADTCWLITSTDGIHTSTTEVPRLKCTQVYYIM